jgi:hypothetical protein
MFHDILDYYVLDANGYYKSYNLLGTSGVGSPINSNTVDSEAGDQEDDDELFDNTSSSGKNIKIPGTFKTEVDDIVGKW